MSNLHILLSRLDFTFAGLAEVKKAIDTGDEFNAQNALIRYFQQRPAPGYLFDEKNLSGDYDPEIIADADQVCRHQIFGYDLGPRINWAENATQKTSNDLEWIVSLWRHNFWHSLARAYWITRAEKYAREFVKQMREFMERWPMEPHLKEDTMQTCLVKSPWRPIDTAIRVYTSWLPLFYCFRMSPSLDSEAWVCYLNALHDHGEFLSLHYTDHRTCSNWDAMEASALFQLGALFPEFQKAKEWRQLGYRRVAQEVRYQFDQDGVHIERTPVYHLVAANAFLQAYRIAVANNVPVPPYMLPVLERSAEFLMMLMKPDLSLPMVGDADRNSLGERKTDQAAYEGMNLTLDPEDTNELRSFFRTMAALTGRKDFLYFASCRKEGRPPSKEQGQFREAGFYVFRSGWKKHDSYFMVSGTHVERGINGGHSHADTGHLELQIEGEDVLIDSGRYLYGHGTGKWLEYSRYFSSTRAHNTVEVDGELIGQGFAISQKSRLQRTFCHSFIATPELALIDISHNGYACLASPVFHRRRILCFKPGVWLVDDVLTGMGSHCCKAYYHFAPGRLEFHGATAQPASFYGKNVVVEMRPLLPDGLISSMVMGQESPVQGWVSFAYGIKVPAPVLVYTKDGSIPVRFLTAIIREGKGTVAITDFTGEMEVNLVVHTGDFNWQVCLALDEWEVERNGKRLSSREK